MKTKIVNIQLALFFQENISRPDKVSTSINHEMNNLFDAMPFILPMPNDAPAEIPIVQMKSELNKEYNCNIARSRVDFYFNPEKEISDFEDFEKEYDAHATKFISAVFKSIKPIKISRLGFVVQYFVEDNNPTETIKRKLISKELGSLRDLSIRFNQNNSVGNIKINDITNIQTGKVTKNNKESNGILVQRDFNNIVKKNMGLTISSLKTLLKKAYSYSTKKFIEE